MRTKAESLLPAVLLACATALPAHAELTASQLELVRSTPAVGLFVEQEYAEAPEVELQIGEWMTALLQHADVRIAQGSGGPPRVALRVTCTGEALSRNYSGERELRGRYYMGAKVRGFVGVEIEGDLVSRWAFSGTLEPRTKLAVWDPSRLPRSPAEAPFRRAWLKSSFGEVSCKAIGELYGQPAIEGAAKHDDDKLIRTACLSALASLGGS